eukprot:COSAG05_NODE_3371_length_2106_cov_4.593197_2_plen_80_part_00
MLSRYIQACTSIEELKGIQLLMEREGMAVLQLAAEGQICLLNGLATRGQEFDFSEEAEEKHYESVAQTIDNDHGRLEKI